MIILSDREFEERYQMSMNEIKELYLKKLHQNSSKETIRITEKYRVVAVLFNKTLDEYYEKIKVEWKDKATIKNYKWITKYSEIPIYIVRYGFEHNSASAIYLSIHTDTKYEIKEKPTITNWLKKDEPNFNTILNSPNHKIYRFKETNEAQFIKTSVKMGLPDTIIQWTKFGFGSAILIPISLILLGLLTNKILPFTFELMAGVIALLVGARVLIFKDITLMEKWNFTYLFLITCCMVILILLMFIPEIMK